MKKLFVLLFVALFSFVLVACDQIPTDSDPKLTTIAIIGAESIVLEFEEAFNVLEGVTALGNDGVDYTSQITYLSTSAISEDHMLNTTITGEHAIRYEVRIDSVLVQKWRFVTVKTPDRPDDGLVVNGDFALGTVFWDDGANGFYVADGAALTLTVEDGALRADVVAGSNMWTPRFGQQNIPFEQGKTYEVSFRAKASVEKEINLQVGELIDRDPWFVDFKPMQTEHRTITTEWVTYTYMFTMNLDNPRGGILFEMGNVNGRVDATIWFDDIVIVETELGEDVTAPVFTGVKENHQILVGSAFNPMEGVTAYDFVDGDVTSEVTFEIYQIIGEEETLVTELDEENEGVYKVVYTVTDAAGNVATAHMMLETLFTIGEPVKTYPGWRRFVNDWEGSAGHIETVDGQLVFTVTDINMYENWQAQVIQDAFALGIGADNVGHMALVAGATYRVTFDAKASVAGDITLAIGRSVGGWSPYFVYGDVSVTTEMQTFTIEFTLDAEGDYSMPAQFKLEMGLLFAGLDAPQTFTLANVKIEIEEDGSFVDTNLIFNGTFEEGPVIPKPEWNGYGMTVVETETEVSITYAGITGSWWNTNAQLSNILFDGNNDTVLFTFTGVVGQDYLFKIEGGGVDKELGMTADGTEQVLELSLVGLTKAQRDGLNLVIVFAQTLDANGTLVIHNIEFVTSEDPVLPEQTWTGYGMTVVETETEVSITYAGITGSWWNTNAQLSNIIFDGNNDTVLFTFTGVAGQDYLFKIEGGGVDRELGMTADGTEQVLELSLVGLTKAQRDGLNLVIVFAQTLDASGTLVIHSVEFVTDEDPVLPELTWTGYGMTVVETETEVSITYEGIEAGWWSKNAQLSNIVFDGNNDTVLFTFTGVAGQSYNFKIEGGGFNREVSITADGTQQVLELSLVAMHKEQRDGLNLIVVFAQTLNANGTLVIHNIEFVTDEDPVLPELTWTGYGMTVVETETEVSITYAGITSAWWDTNAQMSNILFDGNNDTVVFTFTGEVGQSYMFKIEGGGVARELAMTADGTVQVLELSLVDLTKVQRDGLSLIVIFAQTLDASGTLVIHSIEFN